jgi:hypothetical protein
LSADYEKLLEWYDQQLSKKIGKLSKTDKKKFAQLTEGEKMLRAVFWMDWDESMDPDAAKMTRK